MPSGPTSPSASELQFLLGSLPLHVTDVNPAKLFKRPFQVKALYDRNLDTKIHTCIHTPSHTHTHTHTHTHIHTHTHKHTHTRTHTYIHKHNAYPLPHLAQHGTQTMVEMTSLSEYEGFQDGCHLMHCGNCLVASGRTMAGTVTHGACQGLEDGCHVVYSESSPVDCWKEWRFFDLNYAQGPWVDCYPDVKTVWLLLTPCGNQSAVVLLSRACEWLASASLVQYFLQFSWHQRKHSPCREVLRTVCNRIRSVSTVTWLLVSVCFVYVAYVLYSATD